VAKIGVAVLFATGALLLGAGMESRILALSPQNREAQALGPLSAYLEGQGENATIWVKLRDGQVLKGQFKVKVGGSFGALGLSRGLDRPGGAYTSDGDPIMHGNPAFIDMEGANGAKVHCEVMHDHSIDHGSGVCAFSNGAEYRVLY
jgi:hypothetical protein